MKIIVCINHVPDTEAKIKVGPDGATIDKTGINFMLSPYDEFAIEAALRLKEKAGGETVAMTLGGDTHKESLRKALAMGVEKAVLLKDDAVRDSDSIARALAEEIRGMGADCVLFGKQSIDYSDEAVPALVAEYLGLPSVSCIVKFDVQGTSVTCEREIEGGHEVVETALPAVFSTQKGLNEPRYPSLKGIMAAKTKPIEERPAKPFPNLVQVVAMSKPAAKASGKIVGTDASAAAELVRLLHEEAKVI